MTYATVEDVEDLSGFGPEDMTSGGRTMTREQWAAFIPKILSRVEARIHKYCNVVSFLPHAVVEFHEGRWPQDANEWPRTPGTLERAYLGGALFHGIETVFFPREQPAISVSEVAEDMATYDGLPSWVIRTPRTATASGDYQVITRSGMTMIQFHRKVPRSMPNGLRITYQAGYQAGSQELEDIADIALRMTVNYLIWKRRIQEYQTLRDTGVSDYQKPLEQIEASKWIMTAEIKMDLARHVQRSGLSPDLLPF